MTIPTYASYLKSYAKVSSLPAGAPSLGAISFTPTDGRPAVRCGLGDGPAKVTEGFGTWEKVARARRESFVRWTGTASFTLEIPLLFTALLTPGNRDVEQQIRRLENMARPDGTDGPPRVIINAKGLVPYDQTYEPDLVWVIADLDLGSDLTMRRSSDGKRVRESGLLHAYCYVDADDLAKVSPAARHRSNSKHKPARSVVVHKGDTLTSIAKAHHTTVHELKKLNSIRDPRKWLADHKKIKVA